MRSLEFTHRFDDEVEFKLAESEIRFYQEAYEMYKSARESGSGHIFESESYDKWYDFCKKYNGYASSNANPNIGDFYSFVQFMALPDHKKMIIKESKDSYKLIKIDDRFWFDIGLGPTQAISIPSDSNYKSFVVIFDNNNQKNGCMMDFKLKFSDWDIKFYEV